MPVIEKSSRDLPNIESSGGCHAQFYLNGAKVDDEQGPYAVKILGSEAIRDVVYERQRVGAEHGLAPPVGQRVDYIDEDGRRSYGYETRVGTPLEEIGVDESTLEELRELLTEFSVLGWPVSMDIDLHTGNLAHWQGELVIIDWGLGSEMDQEVKGLLNLWRTEDGLPHTGDDSAVIEYEVNYLGKDHGVISR